MERDNNRDIKYAKDELQSHKAQYDMFLSLPVTNSNAEMIKYAAGWVQDFTNNIAALEESNKIINEIKDLIDNTRLVSDSIEDAVNDYPDIFGALHSRL